METEDKKIKYKYEDGCDLASVLTECIVDAPLVNVLCLFAEIDVFKDWMPDMTEAFKLKSITDFRGLYMCKQSMPWPMWHRDMVM
jgi:hypothetical protein